jgi:hypothetical protein
LDKKAYRAPVHGSVTSCLGTGCGRLRQGRLIVRILSRRKIEGREATEEGIGAWRGRLKAPWVGAKWDLFGRSSPGYFLMFIALTAEL